MPGTNLSGASGVRNSLATVNSSSAALNFALVGGVIRNTGSGWDLISTGSHNDVEVSAVSSDTSFIYIDYPSSGSFLNAISFVICPDETLAEAGLFCGASVSASRATIELYKVAPVYSGNAYYSSGWNLSTHTTAGVTAAWDSGNNELKITHPTMTNGLGINLTPRGTLYRPVIESSTTTTFNVGFYNTSDAKVTTEDTNMVVTFSRNPKSSVESLNPANVNTTTYPLGNLWFMGMFER